MILQEPIDTLLTSFGCDSIVITNLFVDSIIGGSSINQVIVW